MPKVETPLATEAPLQLARLGSAERAEAYLVELGYDVQEVRAWVADHACDRRRGALRRLLPVLVYQAAFLALAVVVVQGKGAPLGQEWRLVLLLVGLANCLAGSLDALVAVTREAGVGTALRLFGLRGLIENLHDHGGVMGRGICMIGLGMALILVGGSGA